MNYSKVICQVCGTPFDIMTWKLGQGRGKTCSKECRHEFQKKVMAGSNSPLWRGGYYFDRDGYKLISNKEHPFCNAIGYVREHRLVMEETIGRYLSPMEVVHHINSDKSDNRIENLKLVSNNSSHMAEHKRYPTSCICGDISMCKGLCCRHYNRYYEKGLLDYAPRKRFNK